MLSDITIGQFFPGDSLLHRLDPRTKIILLFFFLVAIFAVSSAASYALLAGMTFALILVSHVPLRMMLRSVKPLWWIILLPSSFIFSVRREKNWRKSGFSP